MSTRRLVTVDLTKSELSDGTVVYVALSEDLPEVVVQETTAKAAAQKYSEIVRNLTDRGVIDEGIDLQLRPSVTWTSFSLGDAKEEVVFVGDEQAPELAAAMH